MKKLTEKITQFIENFKNVHTEARKIGFAGIMNLLWKDLFVGRSLFQWLYLIVPVKCSLDLGIHAKYRKS